MELLTQDWSLSSKLRLPAISRLQKVHNVDLALQVLRSKGVDLKDERGNYPTSARTHAIILLLRWLGHCHSWCCIVAFLFSGSNIESKDIVDGHREKTLGLLWKIMFAFHVCCYFFFPHQWVNLNISFFFFFQMYLFFSNIPPRSRWFWMKTSWRKKLASWEGPSGPSGVWRPWGPARV